MSVKITFFLKIKSKIVNCVFFLTFFSHVFVPCYVFYDFSWFIMFFFDTYKDEIYFISYKIILSVYKEQERVISSYLRRDKSIDITL